MISHNKVENMKLKRNDVVTVKETIDCYYSGYAGRRKQSFTSNDRAIVVKPDCPKVTKKWGDKSSDYFAFCLPTTFDWPEGVGISLDNIVVLKTKDYEAR